MVQVARPSADTTLGNYEDEGAGTTNIYQSIDEVTPSDADYITSEAAPSASVYVSKLTTLEDPVSSTGHTYSYRIAKSAAGGAQINCTVELRQGYVNEGTPGTLIATHSYTDISDTWTQHDEVLTAGEADAITDYTDLYLRVSFTQV